MCGSCMDNVRSSRGICPLCRCPIDMSLPGRFAAEFVDLAPDMIAAAYEPLRQAQAAVYTGMYQHIRVFLLIGVICGACSLLCFMLAPFLLILAPLLLLPGVVLAGMGFVIGYIPWLAVSIVAFEEQQSSSQGSRHQLFAREDLRKPWRLAVKSVILAAGGPLACMSFFIPYALYAGVLRPFARRAVPITLHFLIRALLDAACYSYIYLIRPTWQLAARLTASGKALMRRLNQKTMQWRRRCSRALAGVADELLAHAGNVTMWIVREVIAPAWNKILKPCGYAAASAARWSYDMFLRRLLLFGQHRLAEASYLFSKLRSAAVICISWACVNIFHPVLSGAYRVAAVTAEWIASGAGMVYLHVLNPSGKLLSWMVASWSLLWTSLHMHVVSPTWRTMSDIAIIAHGLLEAMLTAVTNACNVLRTEVILPSYNIAWEVCSSLSERIFIPAAHQISNSLHSMIALVVQVAREVSHIIGTAAQDIAQAFGGYGRG